MTNNKKIAKIKECMEEYVDVENLLTDDEVEGLLNYVTFSNIVRIIRDYHNLCYKIQEILEM